MAKVLVVAGSHERSLIYDIAAIHQYMSDKNVIEEYYLTVASIPRHVSYHGWGQDQPMVFNPAVNSKFWEQVDKDDFVDTVRKRLIEICSALGATGTKIIFVILTHCSI